MHPSYILCEIIIVERSNGRGNKKKKLVQCIMRNCTNLHGFMCRYYVKMIKNTNKLNTLKILMNLSYFCAKLAS